MATMNTVETETDLPVVLAWAVNDDDADTWPTPGSHESFLRDDSAAYLPTLLS